MTQAPQTIHLKDYTPTPFALTHVELAVDLHPEATRTHSKIRVSPRSNHAAPLILQGEGLTLAAISIDGVPLATGAYSYENDSLSIHAPPTGDFTLEITQECNPKANTALSGLYLTNGVYCTQMEAEGFRRFAFFYDRPDVMATYRVRVEADVSLPVLLSNGNLVEQGRIAGTSRHFAIWDDPHPKPTYLFALVAGDLDSVHDSFVTFEGRKVSLGIYVEKGKADACGWAMESLKASMLWEEQRFGRAYDLDVFNIVAVSDFNMGAMENKGLNVFNDKYILARPETATDTDYVNIERIIAHEYFHNWTGNRITCRDWFQLCLKEGLTVFRDQEFTSDLRSRDVKRIEDVKTLRMRQFPEDQGPLAHPVRPSSYIEINNFYTATVYEKGAEICRMLHTLIGPAAFRKAMDLYFERHDGEAATVEDFLACMADASGRDLTQFARWYAQAGTPRVEILSRYEPGAKRFTVTVSQQTPPSPGQSEKQPLHIPLAYALLDQHGTVLPGKASVGVLELKKESDDFSFEAIEVAPHLSINRGFSAPIDLKEHVSIDGLVFRMGHDSDSFNRWEAAQTLAMRLLTSACKPGLIAPSPRSNEFSAALKQVLKNNKLDNAFKALMLQLPSEGEVTAALGSEVDASVVKAARDNVRRAIALDLKDTLLALVSGTDERGPYRPDTEGTARRGLRYAALSLLALADSESAASIAAADLRSPHSMTAEIGALGALISSGHSTAEGALSDFHQRHQGNHLLVDKWFAMHGAWPRTDAVTHVRKLMEHSDFRITTPNRVYALIGSFTSNNLAAFHAADGRGYVFLAETIGALDKINPQVASRMATAFRTWRLYDAPRRRHAQQQLKHILSIDGLSRDVFEIISRTLGTSS